MHCSAGPFGSSQDEELNMINSARYFSDKVDNTMESYSKIQASDSGGRVDYSTGGEYKVNFAGSVDDSGEDWDGYHK